jgi:hypothetical protein
LDIASGMDRLTSTSEHRCWPPLCAGLLLTLAAAAGCSANLPQSGGLTKPEGPAQVTTTGSSAVALGVTSAPAVATTAGASPPAAAPLDSGVIAGFRKSTVTLYSGDESNDGERVTPDSLSLPLPSRQVTLNPSRVEIMTVYGPRWIAKSEVKFVTPESVAISKPQ